MRLINISSLKIGEKLGSPIRMQDGRILLPANAVVTESYITRLTGFGIMSVYVEDEIFEEVQIRPCLSDETKTMALNAVASLYEQISKKKTLNESAIKKASKEMVSDVKSALREPISLFNMYCVNDSRCLHAVNVASIVAALAIESGLNFAMIEEYTQAALCHDIMLENMNDDKDIKHADAGYAYLKESRAFSVRSYMSVMMHHEKYDGTGGPKKMAGKDIAEGARMIAIADMYDNLVYGYAGYKPLVLHHAVEYLNSQAGKVLDPDLLNLFNSSVAIYPTGATVVLNNGFRAVVVAQNPKMPTRPKVRLCSANREECLQFNLLTQNTLFIEKIEL